MAFRWRADDGVSLAGWWMAYRWRADEWRIAGGPMNGVSLAGRWWPNIEWWYGMWIFSGFGPVLLRNPIFVWFSGGPDPLPPPLDPHMTTHWPRILSGWGGGGSWQPCFKSSSYFTEGCRDLPRGPSCFSRAHLEKTQNRAIDRLKICYKWYVHYFNLKIAHTKRYKARNL